MIESVLCPLLEVPLYTCTSETCSTLKLAGFYFTAQRGVHSDSDLYVFALCSTSRQRYPLEGDRTLEADPDPSLLYAVV